MTPVILHIRRGREHRLPGRADSGIWRRLFHPLALTGVLTLTLLQGALGTPMVAFVPP